MVLPAYETDPYLTELETEVLEGGDDGGRPWVRLADTLLYPEGGGQPADRGFVGEVAVLDVQHLAGHVRHFLAAPVSPGPVTVRLDWWRRFDHMQQHTGQHLLSAVAEDRFGLRTTSFHLGEQLCDVELDAAGLAPALQERLEEEVAAEVRRARPVRPRRVTLEEYARLQVRSRGLPPDHHGDVRLVEIEGVDLNTCGGTHLGSTAEIEALALIGSEPLRGGVRLHFLAGGRLRRRLAADEARRGELRAALGVADGELVAAVRNRLEQAREAARREARLRNDLAAAWAAALAARPEALVEAHFDGLDVGFLQLIARSLARKAAGKAAFLTAAAGGEAWFLLAAGGESALDVRAAGAEAAALLGGRGGGSGAAFQGKCPALDGREQALQTLRRRLG